MGPLAPPGGREVLGLGLLPRRRPRRGTDVADRVPALDDEQAAQGVVDEGDVDRAPGLRRPGRQLDEPAIPGGPPEPQHALLHGEVSGVGGLPVDRSRCRLGDQRGDRPPMAIRCHASIVRPPPRPRSARLIADPAQRRRADPTAACVSRRRRRASPSVRAEPGQGCSRLRRAASVDEPCSDPRSAMSRCMLASWLFTAAYARVGRSRRRLVEPAMHAHACSVGDSGGSPRWTSAAGQPPQMHMKRARARLARELAPTRESAEAEREPAERWRRNCRGRWAGGAGGSRRRGRTGGRPAGPRGAPGGATGAHPGARRQAVSPRAASISA